jgi:hypothetical protein
LIILCLKVSYKIDFEFELLKRGSVELDVDFLDVEDSEALPWSLPLRIHPHPFFARRINSLDSYEAPSIAHKGELRQFSDIAIFSPNSHAMAALSCLEPVTVKTAVFSTNK